MTEQYHFKIGWKFPKSKPMVADYTAPNLKTLLSTLEKSEGVSTATTDYLYVHQILPFGGVKEVITHDKAAGTTVVDFTPLGRIKRQEYPAENSEQNAIVNEVGRLLADAAKETKKDKKKKPRIKLKAQAVNLVRTFLYTAAEASGSRNN